MATINYVNEKTDAVSAAVQSESQRAEKAEVGLVSGVSGLPTGGSAGQALFSDATGQPQYADGANGKRALALQSALAAEVKRAQQAEASLLPLSGGTLTGTVTGSVGGIVPQVVGMSGRVVIQTFVIKGVANGSPLTIPFPQAFAPGTTPLVWIQTNPDQWGKMQLAMIGNQSDNLTPNITNTNFMLWDIWQWGSSGGFAGSGGNNVPYAFQCLAIGNM